MKIGIYPGSFNPWHSGHTDILKKALQVFDKVYICRGINPEKPSSDFDVESHIKDYVLSELDVKAQWKVAYWEFEGLLVDCARTLHAHAIIRGLRNGHDLQYEMNQQYWNEDLGLTVPIVYFICDRKLSHISSSTIRALAKINVKKE
jgi:pantetheine-phosphate adenylyltransferase